MRFRSLILCLLAGPILAAMLIAAPEAPEQDALDGTALVRAYVYLRPEATTAAGELRLGELAQVEGFDQPLVETLSRLPLGAAPAPGTSLTLSREDIRRSLVSNMIDPLRVALAGEQQVLVLRRGSEVSASELTALVEQHVARSWQDQPGVRTEITYQQLPETLTLAEDGFELRVMTPLQPRLTGAVSLAVAAVSGDRALYRVPVSFRVRVFRSAAVALRPVGRGEVIAPEDFEFSEHEVTTERSPLVTAVDQAAGKRLVRNLRAGQLLTLDLLENLPLVERGDEVTLVVEYKGIRVGCPGKAWQRGGLGDKIMVRNHYGRNLTGEVLDARTILINP